MEIEIRHHNNEKNGIFIAFINEEKAGILEYTWVGKNSFVAEHTEVENIYRGKKVGEKLIFAAVEFARKNNLKIIPTCSFVNATIKRNKDLQDIL